MPSKRDIEQYSLVSALKSLLGILFVY